MPGVYDALSARLAADAGFPVAFLSGYATSATLLGLPDFGYLTQGEMADVARRVCRAAPETAVIVDADTGYGNALNTRRTVELFESAGGAGIFLEDQVWPKKCGHMAGKRVVPRADWLSKLEAALDARREGLFVVARTDARTAAEPRRPRRGHRPGPGGGRPGRGRHLRGGPRVGGGDAGGGRGHRRDGAGGQHDRGRPHAPDDAGRAARAGLRPHRLPADRACSRQPGRWPPPTGCWPPRGRCGTTSACSPPSTTSTASSASMTTTGWRPDTRLPTRRDPRGAGTAPPGRRRPAGAAAGWHRCSRCAAASSPWCGRRPWSPTSGRGCRRWRWASSSPSSPARPGGRGWWRRPRFLPSGCCRRWAGPSPTGSTAAGCCSSPPSGRPASPLCWPCCRPPAT